MENADRSPSRAGIIGIRIWKTFKWSGATVLIFLALWLTLGSMYAKWRLRKADQAWAAAGMPLETVPTTFPAYGVNESALAVEKSAADLGFDIVSYHPPKRPHPDEKQTKKYLDFNHAWTNEQTNTNSISLQFGYPNNRIDPPSKAMSDYLQGNSSALENLKQAIKSKDIPRWEQDLRLESGAPLPNILGYVKLGDLLTSIALAKLQAGDEAGANDFIEALWKLDQGLRDRPEFVSQMIAVNNERKIIATLRKMKSPPEVWDQRLKEFQFKKRMLQIIAIEAWWAENRMRYQVDESLSSDSFQKHVITPLTAPQIKLAAADIKKNLLIGYVELPKQDFCEYRARIFANSPAHRTDLLFPLRVILDEDPVFSIWKTWERLARIELDNELTLKILQAKRGLHASGGQTWPTVLPGIEATSCRNEKWIYELSPDHKTIKLSFSKKMEWSGQKGLFLPTEYSETIH